MNNISGEFKLSKKLEAICNLVDGNVVADIGCDHGYLAIYLALKKQNIYVYACDVRQSPLNMAKKNALKYGVKEKICFIISDGLRNVPKDVNCVVVAGMGGRLILRIVLETYWAKNCNIKFILQPQSFIYHCRYNLYLNGFEIVKEVPVVQKGRCYVIFSVKYSGRSIAISLKEAILGKICSFEFEDSLQFLNMEYNKSVNILNGLRACKLPDTKRINLYENICDILKEYL